MTDDSPNFAALVAAASHPRAVVVIRCKRCKQLHVPSPDPDVVLCRPCLGQVQALFPDETNGGVEGSS